MNQEIEVVILNEDVKVPEYKTSRSAAFDLVNASGRAVTISPGRTEVIPTGLKIKVPDGFGGFISPRSGISISGFSVNNSPGIVDSDYRDEVKVIAINNGNNQITLEPLERIAQFFIAPILQCSFNVVDEFSPDDFHNERSGGLGHTGRF